MSGLELTWGHGDRHTELIGDEILGGKLAQVHTHAYATAALQEPACDHRSVTLNPKPCG